PCASLPHLWHSERHMFLRGTKRKKDGKEHRYWSVVENIRQPSGPVHQKTLLYLGELNDSQQASWTKALEVFNIDSGQLETRSLFPSYRTPPLLAPGLTPRAALETLAGVQMLDLEVPTSDGRWLMMSRYTQPDKAVELLLGRLKMTLPEQAPPR